MDLWCGDHQMGVRPIKDNVLENKTVFITGGDKGIGRAVTVRMASRYRTVIFTYRTNFAEAREIERLYSNTYSYSCDLADRQQCGTIAREVLEKYGRVDILINNAGYDNDALFLKMQSEQWDSVLNVNLRSLFTYTQPFASSMAEQRWGRIINLTSIAGFTGAFGKSNYAAAKAGIVGFTRSLAQELGGQGITVNAVAPGAILTDMLMRIPEKYRGDILRNIAAKRFGEPEEVADLIEFLSSDKATYINGQTIHINGGSFLH